MMANVLGYDILTLDIDDASAMGAVLLAACAAGRFSDIHEAAETWIRPKHTYSPDEKASQRFTEKYEKFRSLHASLEPFNEFLEKQL